MRQTAWIAGLLVGQPVEESGSTIGAGETGTSPEAALPFPAGSRISMWAGVAADGASRVAARPIVFLAAQTEVSHCPESRGQSYGSLWQVGQIKPVFHAGSARARSMTRDGAGPDRRRPCAPPIPPPPSPRDPTDHKAHRAGSAAAPDTSPWSGSKHAPGKSGSARAARGRGGRAWRRSSVNRAA